MLQYKHILVAIALTEESQQVADAALRMAHASNAKVSIIHVQEHTPVVYGGGELTIPLDVSIEQTLHRYAQQALLQFARRLGIPEDQQYLESGSIKGEIMKVAEKEGVDLIVVGSHRHGRIGAILGSTANGIFHVAKCDVLAVRIYE